MKKFAYIDKGGILHILDSKKGEVFAKEYSFNGKVAETDMRTSLSDYPLVTINGKDTELVCYKDGSKYMNGNMGNGVKAEGTFPEIDALMEKLK
ncbi:MAG: hypothetical protein KHZ62_02200 [Clostridiales bacterium]|nr:hypothetical protein [Clostridiales bacterium]